MVRIVMIGHEQTKVVGPWVDKAKKVSDDILCISETEGDEHRKRGTRGAAA